MGPPEVCRRGRDCGRFDVTETIVELLELGYTEGERAGPAFVESAPGTVYDGGNLMNGGWDILGERSFQGRVSERHGGAVVRSG